MPLENFNMLGTEQDTLYDWSRKLNYIFQYLDSANILSSGLTFGDDQIKVNNIDFGLTTSQVNSSDIPITDATSYFAGTNVEEALQSIGGHVATTNIHYLTSNIDHASLLNIGSNSHGDIDTHISSTTIHYLTSNIDHAGLLNVGSNSHSDIDTHISSTVIHLTTNIKTIATELSTAVTGTTDLTNNVALASELNATNTLINQIRQILIDKGICSS